MALAKPPVQGDLPELKTALQLKKDLFRSVRDASVRNDMFFSDMVDLLRVVESRKTTKTFKERGFGIILNIIRYASLRNVKHHKQVFHRWHEIMAVKPVSGRDLPATGMTTIEKTSKSTQRGVSCTFDINVVDNLLPVLSQDPVQSANNFGMAKYASERFLNAVKNVTDTVNDALTRGAIDEVLRFSWETSVDVVLKSILQTYTDSGGIRELSKNQNAVAMAVKEYFVKSNQMIGRVNKDIKDFILTSVSLAVESTDCFPLTSARDDKTSPLLHNASKDTTNALREDSRELKGVLVVGPETLKKMSNILQPVTLFQDTRHISMKFTNQDYQTASRTEWILPSDERETLQKVTENITLDLRQLNKDTPLSKTLIRGKIDDSENAIGKCRASALLLPDGNLVVVDCVRDIYKDISKTKIDPLEGIMTLSTATMLGANTDNIINGEPNMQVGMQNNNGGMTWIKYEDAKSFLCCPKMFDNMCIDSHIRINDFVYDQYATAHYDTLKTIYQSRQRYPPVRQEYGQNLLKSRNATDCKTLQNAALAKDTRYAKDVQLELHPSFQFYIVDDVVKQGRERPYKEVFRRDEDHIKHVEKTGFIRGFPVFIQGNLPLAYTGKGLRIGQARQLMRLSDVSDTVTESLQLWQSSLNTSTYPLYFYFLEQLLCHRCATKEIIVLNAKTNRVGIEATAFKLADMYYNSCRLLAFSTKRMLLEAWQTLTNHAEVRRHLRNISTHIDKQCNVLLTLGKSTKALNVDVLNCLSPLTDTTTPVPINVSGRSSNVCSGPHHESVEGYEVQHQIAQERHQNYEDCDGPGKNKRYTWEEINHFNGKSTYVNHVKDKVFFNNLLAFTGCRLHTGYVSLGAMTDYETQRVLDWLPLAPVFWDVEPMDDKKELVQSVMAQIIQFQKDLNTAEIERVDQSDNYVYRVTKNVAKHLYRGPNCKLHQCYMPNGVLFLPNVDPGAFGHNTHFKFDMVYVDPRCANPKIPDMYGVDRGVDESFVGSNATSAAEVPPDVRFYCQTQHNYGFRFVRAMENLSDIENVSIKSYAGLALNLSFDPVAFSAYADKIHPGVAFTLLTTKSYQVEHAIFLAKNGLMMMYDPVVEQQRTDNNVNINMNFIHYLAVIENTASDPCVSIPNCTVVKQVSDCPRVIDYNTRLGNATIGDNRKVFKDLVKCLTPGSIKHHNSKQFGSCPESSIELLPCPANTPLSVVEQNRNPMGRDVSNIYVSSHDQYKEVRKNHEVNDTFNLSTYNPWGSLPDSLGQRMYSNQEREGFSQYCEPRQALMQQDILNVMIYISSFTEKKSNIAMTRSTNPSYNQCVAFPQRSYGSEKDFIQSIKMNEVPDYLISDENSPLKGIKVL